MKRKMISLAVISAVLTGFAITAVLASSWTFATPLYTVRMEQASSRMNFLPTEMKGFTYMTERGCSLNYDSLGYCSVSPLSDRPTSPQILCKWTDPYSTCQSTCSTCPVTCPETCYTCLVETCPDTCPMTCGGSTCNPPC